MKALILSKRIFKNPVIIAILILIPVLAFALRNIKEDVKSDKVYVGLYNTSVGEASSCILSDLGVTRDKVLFTVYEDFDTMIRDIDNSTLIGGIKFDENFDQKIASNDVSHLFVTYNKPDSLLMSSVTELVFASFLKHYGYLTSCNYLDSLGLFEKGTFEEEFKKLYDSYSEGKDIFHITYETLSGKISENSPEVELSANVFPLRGVLCLLIFASALFSELLFLIDKEGGAFCAGKKSFLLFSRFFYPFIAAFVFALTALVSMVVSGTFTSFFPEIPALLVLVALSTVFTVLLGLIIRKSSSFSAIIPIFLIGSALLTPVFIDFSVYMPVVSYVNKLFVPYYYLCFF